MAYPGKAIPTQNDSDTIMSS